MKGAVKTLNVLTASFRALVWGIALVGGLLVGGQSNAAARAGYHADAIFWSPDAFGCTPS